MNSSVEKHGRSQVLDLARDRARGQVCSQAPGSIMNRVQDQAWDEVLQPGAGLVLCRADTWVRDQVRDQVMGQLVEVFDG